MEQLLCPTRNHTYLFYPWGDIIKPGQQIELAINQLSVYNGPFSCCACAEKGNAGFGYEVLNCFQTRFVRIFFGDKKTEYIILNRWIMI